jgi:hypothetical protein
MKPDAGSINVLSTVRARAKMHEFRVPPTSYNELPRDPKMLFSLALGILGDAAAALARHYVEPDFDGRPETWTDADGSITEMVRFSATFFDAYLEAQLDTDITAEFSLLCACSYYLSDAVGNATVVVRRSEEPPSNVGGGLALLAFRILGGDYSDFPADTEHGGFAQRLITALRRHFVLEGDEAEIIGMCSILRKQVYTTGSPRELLYGDLVVSLCARKLRNSARNLIPPYSDLPLEAWAPALLKQNFPTELWPAQQRICEAGLLKGRSAVIQMPTSAGKTRATELIIRAAFLSKRTSLAVIVAPFRSLCHDIRTDIVKAFISEDVLLDEVSDSYLFDIELQELSEQKSIIVVTPEKLLYMLRRAPDLAERIGLIVYDEGHQFEGFARGPTYELLLSSLRMTLKGDAQVVLISAVIGNAPEIAAWLIRDRDGVVGDEGMLPTAKSIAFASWKMERGQLQYVQPTDPEELEFFVPRVIAPVTLQKLTAKEKAARAFPERNGKNGTTQSTEIGLYLGLHLVPNGSVAVFCGQKGSVSKTCRRISEIFARKVPLDAPSAFSDVAELGKISDLFVRQMGANADVAAGATCGVLAHHANVPHGLRLTVEHAMKEGHARFVVCTSTLAQGVNFPIKYLIVTATQQGKEKIKVRDFHNLMGRAGRAGMHTESSVIFAAAEIFDGKDSYHHRWRWDAAQKLLDATNAEPSRSSIMEVFDDYQQTMPPVALSADPEWLDLVFADTNSIEAVVASVVAKHPIVSTNEFRDYLAGRARAIQSIAAYLATHVDFDDPDADKKVEGLAANTLAYHLADKERQEKLLQIFATIAEKLRTNADADYRALIRKSPLPPADIKLLSAWLTSNQEALLQAAADGNLLELVVEKALPFVTAKSLRSLDAQQGVLPALKLWMSGGSFAEVQAGLTAAGQKIGNSCPTAEHAVAICEDGFGYHLAMILASITDLAEAVSEDLRDSVASVHRQVKNGLASDEANAFYEAGFADRIVAQELAAAFPGTADRSAVKTVCLTNLDGVLVVLGKYPDYFISVAKELSTP